MAANDLRVADLMAIDPIVVSADAFVEDAEDLLRQNQITGLPVVDVGHRLVGVISQTDLIYLALPYVQSLIRHGERIRVRDVMSLPPVTIGLEASLRDAARRMTEKRIHRLVAVDDAGRPVGVISAMDFVGLYAES